MTQASQTNKPAYLPTGKISGPAFRHRKKLAHSSMALVGGGVLVLTYLAVEPPSAELAHDDVPNPGLLDGTYLMFGEGPIKSLTMYVENGRITRIDVTYNDHNRKSHALNTGAVARMRAQVLAQQNADGIDFVTGATATSEQFVTSMQAVIDRARP